MNRVSVVILTIFIILTNMQTVYGNVCVSAESAIAVDADSGRVLYSLNKDNKMPMASTTKIMTAIVALEKGKLDDIVQVSEKAATTEGSSMYLTAGEKISLLNLLYGLMLSSGNDAATAISEHIAGSEEEFVAIMNDTAKSIGANDTYFENPHGLPAEKHYSTAFDMAKITAYGLNIPKFREIVSTKIKSVPWEGREYDRILNNHNKLLSMYKGCIGVKTGFTKVAGRCLVSAAERGGMTVICVTLNAPDDWNDHMNIYNSVFEKYKKRIVISRDETLGNVRVKGGINESVDAVCAEEVAIPLKEDETFEIEVNCIEEIKAPVYKNINLGYVTIKINGEESAKVELLPQKGIDAKNIFFPQTEKTFGSYLYDFFFNWLAFNTI